LFVVPSRYCSLRRGRDERHHPVFNEPAVFGQWQARYAEHGIVTFPVERLPDGRKKALITNWQKVGRPASQSLAKKFGNATALGCVAGGRNGITTIDVDTTDEKVLGQAIDRHGQPPVVFRTATGKFHLPYRHNGEGRHIRPWKDRPIDLLGGGLVVLPPSRFGTGHYEIIQGHFDDLDRLQPAENIEAHLKRAKEAGHQNLGPLPAEWSGMRQGDGRNRALWEECMRAGEGCNLERMIEVGRGANHSFGEPLPDPEVVKIATSAWRYNSAGRNFFARPRVMLDHTLVDELPTDAIALLVVLKRFHGGKDSFVLANGMARKLHWGLGRFQIARDCLVAVGEIICISPGGRGPHDPPIYGWSA
jgi:hypothetical protein